MDILIELVIALFRTLFGSQEPQAKVGPKKRRPLSGARGPYDYGGQRPPASRAGGPKTLAELLEEARREMNAPGSSGASGGPAPAARAEVLPEPASSPPVRSPRPAPAQRAAPARSPAARRAVRAPRTPPAYPAPPPAAPAPPPRRKKRRKPKQVPPPATPAGGAKKAPPTMHGMRKMRGMRAAHGFAPAKGKDAELSPAAALAPWIEQLRDSTGEEKRLAGAQAMVNLEIFGPPRCRRPHRPGAWSF